MGFIVLTTDEGSLNAIEANNHFGGWLIAPTSYSASATAGAFDKSRTIATINTEWLTPRPFLNFPTVLSPTELQYDCKIPIGQTVSTTQMAELYLFAMLVLISSPIQASDWNTGTDILTIPDLDYYNQLNVDDRVVFYPKNASGDVLPTPLVNKQTYQVYSKEAGQGIKLKVFGTGTPIDLSGSPSGEFYIGREFLYAIGVPDVTSSPLFYNPTTSLEFELIQTIDNIDPANFTYDFIDYGRITMREFGSPIDYSGSIFTLKGGIVQSISLGQFTGVQQEVIVEFKTPQLEDDPDPNLGGNLDVYNGLENYMTPLGGSTQPVVGAVTQGLSTFLYDGDGGFALLSLKHDFLLSLQTDTASTFSFSDAGNTVNLSGFTGSFTTGDFIDVQSVVGSGLATGGYFLRITGFPNVFTIHSTRIGAILGTDQVEITDDSTGTADAYNARMFQIKKIWNTNLIEFEAFPTTVLGYNDNINLTFTSASTNMTWSAWDCDTLVQTSATNTNKEKYYNEIKVPNTVQSYFTNAEVTDLMRIDVDGGNDDSNLGITSVTLNSPAGFDVVTFDKGIAPITTEDIDLYLDHVNVYKLFNSNTVGLPQSLAVQVEGLWGYLGEDIDSNKRMIYTSDNTDNIYYLSRVRGLFVQSNSNLSDFSVMAFGKYVHAPHLWYGSVFGNEDGLIWTPFFSPAPSGAELECIRLYGKENNILFLQSLTSVLHEYGFDFANKIPETPTASILFNSDDGGIVDNARGDIQIAPNQTNGFITIGDVTGAYSTFTERYRMLSGEDGSFLEGCILRVNGDTIPVVTPTFYTLPETMTSTDGRFLIESSSNLVMSEYSLPTATPTLKQVPVLKTPGDVLEWDYPVEIFEDSADKGRAYKLNFVASDDLSLGISNSSGTATITYGISIPSSIVETLDNHGGGDASLVDNADPSNPLIKTLREGNNIGITDDPSQVIIEWQGLAVYKDGDNPIAKRALNFTGGGVTSVTDGGAAVTITISGGGGGGGVDDLSASSPIEVDSPTGSVNISMNWDTAHFQVTGTALKFKDEVTRNIGTSGSGKRATLIQGYQYGYGVELSEQYGGSTKKGYEVSGVAPLTGSIEVTSPDLLYVIDSLGYEARYLEGGFYAQKCKEGFRVANDVDRQLILDEQATQFDKTSLPWSSASVPLGTIVHAQVNGAPRSRLHVKLKDTSGIPQWYVLDVTLA